MKILVSFLVFIIIILSSLLSYNYGFFKNEIIVEQRLEKILKEHREEERKNSIMNYFSSSDKNESIENNSSIYKNFSKKIKNEYSNLKKYIFN